MIGLNFKILNKYSDPDSIYYFRIFNKKIRKSTLILIVSSIFSAIIFIIAIALGLYRDYIILSYIIIVAMAISILPYAVYRYLETKNIRTIEEYYPKFLRDLSEALASGMDLLHALKHVSQINYGPLNKYIKKLYIWLSWGESFEKAFSKFNKFFLLSYKIQQTNDIVLETYRYGGDLSKVLKRISYDLESIENLIKLKNSYISQQVVVLYVIFFIFIGLLIVLKNTLSVMFAENIFSGGELFGVKSNILGIDHFKRISTLAIIVNGIIISFIIGAVEGKRISEAFRHLIITLLASILAVMIFILPPDVNISVNVYPKSTYIGEAVIITGRVIVDSSPLKNYQVDLIIRGPIESQTYSLKTREDGSIEQEYIPLYSGNYTIILSVFYNNRLYTAQDRINVI